MSDGKERRSVHQPLVAPGRELDREPVCDTAPSNATAARQLGGGTDDADGGDGLRGDIQAIVTSTDDPDPTQHVTAAAYCAPLAARWTLYRDGPFWNAPFWEEDETRLPSAYVRERVNPLAGLDRWLTDAPDPEDRARQLRLVLAEVPEFEAQVLSDGRLRGALHQPDQHLLPHPHRRPQSLRCRPWCRRCRAR
ncbi:MAG: hypothetical protein ACJAZO_001670 [Myxococcota bacterium]|jgi:hypothetical protein